jgi:uncharacterized lipoprotein YddW (UPF0748 family)
MGLKFFIMIRITVIIQITITATNFLSCAKIPQPRKHEVRAVWMTRIEYAEDKSVEESKTFISKSFQKLSKAGINIVVFQIRGNADALYRSAYEPWSKLLTDTLGKDPGWDPLAFALDKAHKLGIELHTWVNTFPAWKTNDPPPTISEPLHPMLAHPEWIVCDSTGQPMQPTEGYITFSPGIPEVRGHIKNVVMDIVQNYDIDGIHFDYIRYPEWSNKLGYSHDSVSVQQFSSKESNPTQLSWENWQREQINLFVANIYNEVTEIKPWVKISAAVIGFHHGRAWNGYHVVYQDVRRWMATGKIDIVFPMMYVQIGDPKGPFEKALTQWKGMTHLGRPIIPGMGAYRVGRHYGWQEIWDQIEMIRKEQFPGMMFFSAYMLLKGIDLISEQYYPARSLTLPMPWKKNVPVLTPFGIEVDISGDSINVKWGMQEGIYAYVIYKTDNISDANNIIAIHPGFINDCKLQKVDNGSPYYITAVNRIGIESEPVAILNEKERALP